MPHIVSAIAGAVLLVSGIVALFVACFHAGTPAPFTFAKSSGLKGEDELAISLVLWLFIYGIIAVVSALVGTAFYCCSAPRHRFVYAWAFALAFLGPWLIFGSIDMARVRENDSALGVWVMSLIALVISYIVVGVALSDGLLRDSTLSLVGATGGQAPLIVGATGAPAVVSDDDDDTSSLLAVPQHSSSSSSSSSAKKAQRKYR
jgi:hypothetical protein